MFKDYNTNQIKTVIQKALDENSGYFTFKCETRNVYDMMKKRLIEEKLLFTYLGQGITSLSFTENEVLVAAALALLMILAGIGAGLFIIAGTQNASMEKLLKEGDFTEKEKKRSSLKETVGFCYWGVLTAIFLLWGFLGKDGGIGWQYNWIVFVIGGVLFPIVMCICNAIADKKK
jgi:predicted permease